MRSSYAKEDVELLLKDITGLVTPLPASVREQYIQSGTHYCEMLPLEYSPSARYLEAYQQALINYAAVTAKAAGVLAEKIYRKKGSDPVIVSLARAGIPIGILLRRYLHQKYQISVKHYAISIIRGRGIDKNAVDYILARHPAESVQFIDGWIGKGAILTQLKDALADYPQLDGELGVLSDPAELTALCGTHEDILIPSSCLNATVTGLISRTFLRDDIIKPGDFHGAAYYGELKENDLSEDFLTAIAQHFDFDCTADDIAAGNAAGKVVVQAIAEAYQISNINYIKPGIGEATRVLLRRIPWKIIVNPEYADSPELLHIRQLAAEKEVVCEESCVPLGRYKVCGIIKNLSDV